MFSAALSLLAVAFFSSFTLAQDASIYKIGYTGTLSSLDGGLGGVVKVLNSTALEIDMYTLKDASAPALYWWGTTDGVLKDGFRISNKHVTMAATSPTLIIILDAGKTTADFTTVGLWCEMLTANFGQATLAAPTTATAGMTASPTASSTAAASSTTKASAGNMVASSNSGMALAFVVAVAFAAWMR